MYCSIERRVMAAERACVMIQQAMPTVECVLTRRSATGSLAQTSRSKKHSSGPPAILDVGLRAETVSRKI